MQHVVKYISIEPADRGFICEVLTVMNIHKDFKKTFGLTLNVKLHEEKMDTSSIKNSTNASLVKVCLSKKAITSVGFPL